MHLSPWRQVLHNLTEHDKEKVKHCSLLWAPFDCLFVRSIYIPSIQSSHSSHSPIGDSTSAWIHSSPCLCSFLIKLPTGLSPDQGDKLAKRTRSHMKCVYAANATEKHVQELWRLHCTVYLYRSSYSYTKFTLVSWDWARGRASLCVYRVCTHSFRPNTEIDLLTLNISHKLWITL